MALRSTGTVFSRPPPGQRINRAVVAGITLLLLLVVASLWLYLYFKSLEKPYRELKGYRVATTEQFNSFLRRSDNRERTARLFDYLKVEGVDEVLDAENLLRQGTDWLDVGESPFAIPPRDLWRNMVATLALVRDELEPSIGPVSVVSAYRTANYNRKSGGRPSSRHRDFCGLDLVPQSNISHKELVEELRSLHARLGPDSDMGLGIYQSLRFHIDTCGYRSW